jgi:hypothetical protein
MGGMCGTDWSAWWCLAAAVGGAGAGEQVEEVVPVYSKLKQELKEKLGQQGEKPQGGQGGGAAKGGPQPQAGASSS